MASSTRGKTPRTTTTKSPRAARPGAVPVKPPALQPVQLEDGTQVVFSFSHYLAQHGLTGSKPVEVGGRIFQFRATGTMEENTLLFQHMATGKYREALALQLVDPSEVDELMALVQVPFATVSEQKMWLAFTEAVSGVTVGESSAS